MKRICVVITTRGNFAKTKSMMRAINAHADLELQLVAGGALLGRQSAILDEIRRDGFTIDRTLDYMMAAETPEAIGVGAALCAMRMVAILNDLRPDTLVWLLYGNGIDLVHSEQLAPYIVARTPGCR